MGVIDGTVRTIGQTVSRAAAATTAAAGAVGGAAINGFVGGVKGATEGIQQGVSAGSKSTPAAALAIGAIGVAGLVEWPILLAVGGGALLLRRLGMPGGTAKTQLAAVPSEPVQRKAAPQKKTPTKSAAKKTAGRRAGSSTALRSTN